MPQIKYRDNNLKKYLDDLAAKIPAPGGGSAAALSATLGASLISMVINFSLGKMRFAKYESRLKDALRKSEAFRQKFTDLIDLDVEAYQSKDIRVALNIPFMVCRLSHQAIGLCPYLIDKTNQNLISDLAVAAILLESAYSSAYFNVEINLKLLADKKLASGIKRELSGKTKQVRRLRMTTEEKVGKIIRG